MSVKFSSGQSNQSGRLETARSNDCQVGKTVSILKPDTVGWPDSSLILARASFLRNLAKHSDDIVVAQLNGLWLQLPSRLSAALVECMGQDPEVVDRHRAEVRSVAFEISGPRRLSLAGARARARTVACRRSSDTGLVPPFLLPYCTDVTKPKHRAHPPLCLSLHYSQQGTFNLQLHISRHLGC